MRDKQLEDKKKEFRELEVQLYREMKENAKVTGVHDLDELDEKKWQWIEKLVEEVEDELIQEVEGCIYDGASKGEHKIDVEKFLDLKDEIESKRD